MTQLIAPLLITVALLATGARGAETQTIYQLDIEVAKDMAREVMQQAQGTNKVNEWIERTRTTFSVSGGGVWRGGWSWGLSVQSVSALTADGRRITGVVFEPHASHGPGTGKGEYTEIESEKLLTAVLARADQTGKALADARVLGGSYGAPFGNVAEVAPPLSTQAEEIVARLRALKSLHDSGAINDAEYEQKRKELLARF